MRSIKNINSPLLKAYLVFIAFSALFYFYSSGKTYLFTSDFHFYHSFANELLGKFSSEFSNNLKIGEINPNWHPSYLYSILFLSPITLLGSKELFFIEGIIAGLIIINNLNLAIRNLNNKLENQKIFIILLIIILFPSFLIETISVSTNAVFFLFGLLAFNANNNIKRIVFLIIASLIRPNYITMLFSVFIANLIFRPKGFKMFFVICIPSIISYLVAYKYNFSAYPGSGLNYILLAESQNINYFHNYSQQLFSDLLKNENIPSIGFWDANIFQIIKLIFSSQEVFVYFINLFITKISLTLGYLHEALTISNTGLWFIKAWRTIYFIIITLPSFYISILILYLNRVSKIEKTLIASSIIMILINSALVGVPKYFVGIHSIFVYCLFIFFDKQNYFKNSLQK